MSERGSDLTEFTSSFVSEAEDLVAVANRELLAMEEAGRRGGRNGKAAREVFRAVHTIKGLAAMVGVEPIVVIAHRLESILRETERGPVVPDVATIDALLAAVAAIQARLASVAKRAPIADAPAALLDRLDAVVAPPRPSEVALPSKAELPPVLVKLDRADWEQIDAGRARGLRAAWVEFVPSQERSTLGINITSVRQSLAALGEVVRAVPLTRAGQPGGIAFGIVLLTDRPLAEVATAAHTTANQVHEVQPPGLGPAIEASPDRALVGAPELLDASLLGMSLDDVEGGHLRNVVRVEIERLDDAMERLSALIVTRFRLSRAVAALAAEGVNPRELEAILKDNARQLRDLRTTILRIRMVRLTELLERIPLLVRTLCRATGKQIRLELDAGNAELDKKVAEAIFPALVHLIRNAVDHAIEAPHERVALGKPAEGLLRITCVERSNTQMEIGVSDDGRGVDRERVAARAGRAIPTTDAALLELICLPGLSTQEGATATSGRGMGMDIVKQVVTGQLGGELQLATRAGQGTTLTLKIPLTITILDAFSLECAGHRFVVPVSAVEEILELDPQRVVRGPARRATDRARLGMIERRGEAVPVVRLDLLFELPQPSANAPKALVVRRAGTLVAFAVDRLLGQHEVVVRPLEDPLVKVPGVSGSTDLGDGRPTLVLDLPALAAHHLDRRPRGAAA